MRPIPQGGEAGGTWVRGSLEGWPLLINAGEGCGLQLEGRPGRANMGVTRDFKLQQFCFIINQLNVKYQPDNHNS